MTTADALKLARGEVDSGYLNDFYVVPETGSVIGVCDQGEFVLFDAKEEGFGSAQANY